MAAALQFSEELVEESITVAGRGGAGADMIAHTTSGLTIGREVSVYQGGISNLYGKIIEEADQIAANIDLPQVLLQVTQGFLNNANARQRIVEAATNAQQLFFRQGTEAPKLFEAIAKFLVGHRRSEIQFLDEQRFWNLDLSSFKRVDVEYGVSFRGPQSFTSA